MPSSITKGLLLLAALAVVGTACGSDGNSAPRCTAAATTTLVDGSDLSKLFAAVDPQSQAVLRNAIVEQCCALCGGSPDDRPQQSAMESCVTCAADYQSGNPADHINVCAANVCGN